MFEQKNLPIWVSPQRAFVLVTDVPISARKTRHILYSPMQDHVLTCTTIQQAVEWMRFNDVPDFWIVDDLNRAVAYCSTLPTPLEPDTGEDHGKDDSTAA